VVQATEGKIPSVRNLEPEGEQVSLLFALVSEALARSTAALLGEDPQMGQGVVNGDVTIDDLSRETEASVWRRLKGEPPGWDNLRGAVGLLLLLPELERSADLAEHIAQRALTGIGAEMTPASRGIVERMSEMALDMWSRAAKAYRDGTVDCDEFDDADEKIDVLHERLTNEIATGVMPPPVAAQVTLLSRFYERLGDHAVNLARRIDGLPT
jgi:phosphate transport system protein